ncbi:MAG: diphosphate--fructose-6-phosphate 1-phosphotransferase, partial [Chloroflexia bacterium]|nr:diphosphate--fructose-6-phosphate 1-phosphotransferase [Chloroflexia bacterium]
PTLLVGQSGGSTAVINASLVGVIEAARDSGAFGRVLGARNGIEGLFEERFVSLHDQDPDLLGTIRITPSAALGTGRHKLQEGDLDRALDLMRQHGITAFVYIGGNDSADTACRLAIRAAETGQDLRVAAVPKTIDNDLPETDHCPGYGSIARYLANAVRDATYDSIASPQLHAVKFVEVMGRDAGWVAASGVLGFSPEERDLEPLVLLPERAPADVEEVLAAVERDLRRRGWSVVVVPETLRTSGGRHLGGDEPDYIDGFGHPYYPSTGAALTRLVSQQLEVRARYDKPGTAARMSISLASTVDLVEAYALGAGAVERIVAGESGIVTILRRTDDDPYACVVDAAPIERVANRVRHLPDAFIAADGFGVTDAFRRYALPLLGPEPFPRYGRFDDGRQGN